jgi:glycosyltransferase involved in cell wall biosynthesis
MSRQTSDSEVELSIVCPVTMYAGDLSAVHREFREVVARTGRSAEFIYVLDGPNDAALESISRIVEDEFPVWVLRMAKGFGEATALQIGFERARGRLILTIPDRLQIDATVLARTLDRLDRGDEVVITRREPRSDALLNRIQTRVFHGLVRRLIGQNFQDMTCGVRGFTAEAARGLDLYGDQHRFIPVIAMRCGYRVNEIPGKQHPENRGLRVYEPGVYLRRVLDILNIYFLTRFTKKPLRFFGLVGSSIGFLGFLICAVVAIQKLVFSVGLSNRPLLLLGVLLIVLGVQIVSIGLVGEIIIFLSSRREIPAVEELAENVPGQDPEPRE